MDRNSYLDMIMGLRRGSSSRKFTRSSDEAQTVGVVSNRIADKLHSLSAFLVFRVSTDFGGGAFVIERQSSSAVCLQSADLKTGSGIGPCSDSIDAFQLIRTTSRRLRHLNPLNEGQRSQRAIDYELGFREIEQFRVVGK